MFAAEAALSAFLEAVLPNFSPHSCGVMPASLREKGVKVWLDDLKALAYDMEDVLDEFDTEAKQPKPMGGPQITITKVQKLIPTCCSSSGSGALILNENMNRTIKRITKELEAIAKRKFDLPLREDVRGLSNATRGSYRPLPQWTGLEFMTTLAQMIYNDERVKNHFEMGIWACVSDQFDVTRITKAVLESVGAQGSAIIVTTRNEEVAYLCPPFLLITLVSYLQKNVGYCSHNMRCKHKFRRAQKPGTNWEEDSEEMQRIALGSEDIGRSWCYYGWQKVYWMTLAVGKQWRKVGDMCFRNLLMRSFFQQSGRDKSLYLMHELMHELSQFVSGEFCLRMEAGKHQKNPEKVRHSSYLRETYDGSEKFDFLREAYNLRTFLPLNMSFEVEACYLTHKITDLPDSIGNLRHLRYLDISYTAIKKISESVSTLVNLQTLVLSHCYHMNELPKNMGNLINLRHLENSGTSLKGMPMEMKKLKNLQTLSAFVVGKHYGSSIRELRDLFCLGGTLSILNLENVVDAVDAREANVKDKKNLDELVLKWKDNDNNIAVDSQNEASVLEHLQPHKNKCKNCPYLPPLGQLPNLKSLSVVHFDAVKRVGAEFYGNDSSSAKPFGSLETLMFEEMPEWEEWVPLRIQGEEFPCLQKLCIRKCPKLTRDLPCRLSSLRQLEISECRQLVVTLPTVPSICEVKLHECDNVVLESAFHLTSVSSLSASKIFNMTHLPGGQITTSSIQVGLQHLRSLVELHLCNCPRLKELPPILHMLTSLKRLEIRQCPSLYSLPEMGLPSMLERLEIGGCDILQSLPEGMTFNNAHLQELKLEFPLPEEMAHNSYASLETFWMTNSCDSLRSFPLGFFTKLKYLNIWNCENLESLAIPEGLHHEDLTSLETLHICNCPNFVSFPQGGLPTPNLRFFRVFNCEKLKSLPHQLHTQLPSLEGGFKEEDRLESFPEEGLLPSTLTSLRICNLPMKSLGKEGLRRLTSLKSLEIYSCPDIKSFPQDGLPICLSFLTINHCRRLKKGCQRDKGKEWHKIAHIPCIEIDDEVIVSQWILCSVHLRVMVIAHNPPIVQVWPGSVGREGYAQLVRPWAYSPMVISLSPLRATGGLPGC
ncbi:putative disease resistance protein [Vitis vinifera]|uniref:Putative disease resistance protein n=1 Tax=Vitis vinifera TaxID=29760 RepID=A0A438FQY1_VITVI|nr:putative disease resistance protein [Vitis vinifera]